MRWRGSSDPGLMDEDYETRVITVADLLPGGMMLQGGEPCHLTDLDLHIVVDGEAIQLLYTMPIRPTYVECPRCRSENHEDGFIAVFEEHLLIPCWECKSLVILEREVEKRRSTKGNELAKEFR